MKQRPVTRRQLTTIIIATSIFSLLILANFSILFGQARRSVLLMQQNEVLSTAVEADHVFQNNAATINIAAYTINNMLAESADTTAIEGYLTEQTGALSRAVDEDFSGLYGVVNGKYVDGAGWVPEEGYVPEERPWYQEAIEEKGNAALTTPYLDAKTGSMLLSVSRMLADGKSVVSMDMSLNDIQEIVLRAAEKNGWDMVAVLDKNGVVAAHSNPEEFGKNYTYEKGTLGNTVMEEISENGYTPQQFRYQGRAYRLFANELEDGWSFVVAVRETTLLGSLVYLIPLFLVTAVLIFLVTGLLGKRFGKDQEKSEGLTRELHAVANIYLSMHRIDLEKDTITEIAGTSNQVRLIIGGRTEHAQSVLRELMDILTDERFKESIFAFVDFSTLDERMKGRSSITKEFITSKNLRRRGRFVAVDRGEDGKLKSVIWMVGDAEEHENLGEL